MRRLRDHLLSELNTWRLATSQLITSEMNLSPTMSKTRSSFLSKEWYEVLYNNAMLMLFRPSPTLSDTGDSSTLQKLYSSSKQAVVLYALLHRSRKINYSWITLHSVFMAGLTYLYALSRHFRERRGLSSTGATLDSDPNPIDIVNDTRACSNVLVAVSERWNALRHCHEVFDRLSDAVLADAIKLHCPPVRSLSRTPSYTVSEPFPHQRNALESSSRLGVSNTEQVFGSHGNTAVSDSWPGNDTAFPITPGFYSNTSPLAIDEEFRSCFSDLQQLYNEPYLDDPVMQLSHDWLGYIGDISNVPISQGQQSSY